MARLMTGFLMISNAMKLSILSSSIPLGSLFVRRSSWVSVRFGSQHQIISIRDRQLERRAHSSH